MGDDDGFEVGKRCFGVDADDFLLNLSCCPIVVGNNNLEDDEDDETRGTEAMVLYYNELRFQQMQTP